jgi:hypothetical protein
MNSDSNPVHTLIFNVAKATLGGLWSSQLKLTAIDVSSSLFSNACSPKIIAELLGNSAAKLYPYNST